MVAWWLAMYEILVDIRNRNIIFLYYYYYNLQAVKNQARSTGKPCLDRKFGLVAHWINQFFNVSYLDQSSLNRNSSPRPLTIKLLKVLTDQMCMTSWVLNVTGSQMSRLNRDSYTGLLVHIVFSSNYKWFSIFSIPTCIMINMFYIMSLSMW